MKIDKMSCLTVSASGGKTKLRLIFLLLTLFGIFGVSESSQAATVNAISCSQANVQSAIISASAGDMVTVPAGNCSWSSLTINKAIHLKGAGLGKSVITIYGNTINKQAAGITRISDFSFKKSGGGNESKGFYIEGSWLEAEPVIIEGNSFTVSDSGLMRIGVAGGVIIANNSFVSGGDDSFIQPKPSLESDSAASWETADTMGAKDIDGKANIYVEDNVFYGGNAQGIDCDGYSRCVYRYNDLTYSAFNTHGADTSPVGVRHFEVYENTFHHDHAATSIANQNWAIWIRGGTGVIFNNQIDDLAGSYWGDKSEIKFSIRGAEDVRPQGSCLNVTYPVPQQLGQSHNGNNYFTDPIYIWGNTGAQAIDAGWHWGNPCGLTFSNFWQLGRDYVIGSAKSGYSPYAYPHPLRSGTIIDTTAPDSPSGLNVR